MSQLAKVYTRAGVGMEAPVVTIEAHISGGLPSFAIVGLPEGGVFGPETVTLPVVTQPCVLLERICCPSNRLNKVQHTSIYFSLNQNSL